jgi:hypothetical protein
MNYQFDNQFRQAVDQRVNSALCYERMQAANRARRDEPANQANHQDLSKLAHAGIVGFIILAVIAIVAGS